MGYFNMISYLNQSNGVFQHDFLPPYESDEVVPLPGPETSVSELFLSDTECTHYLLYTGL